MGLRARLPLTSTPQRRPATLARQLQPATATQLDRRPATNQPRSQRPWVGHLGAVALAGRAVPRAAAGDTRLVDRRAAALAGLAGAAVHLELVLHRSALAVRQRVVAQRRAPARDSTLERCANRPMERLHLVELERSRRCQRMDARPPQRLVGVDVPDAGDRALVEDRSLHRRFPAGEPRGEIAGAEAVGERLAADAGVEVRIQLARLEQEPGAEAADVAERDV